MTRSWRWSAHPTRSGRPRRPRVDLQLSATLVEPIARHVRSPLDEDLTERRSAAALLVPSRHRPRRHRLPVPPGASQGRHRGTGPVRRRDLATRAGARATSSYPVAFEAAYVRSTRAPSFAPPTRRCADVWAAGRDARCLQRSPAPVGVACRRPCRGRATSSSPTAASSTTSRWARRSAPSSRRRPTVPPVACWSTSTPAPGPRARARMRARPAPATPSTADRPSACWAGCSRRSTSPSRSPATSPSSRRTTNASPGPVCCDEGPSPTSPIGPSSTRPLVASGRAYRQHRNIHDAGLVCRLLDDPAAALGDDRFPIIDGVTDGRWRSPLAYWSGEDREEFESRLVQYFDDRFAAAAVHPRRRRRRAVGRPAPARADRAAPHRVGAPASSSARAGRPVTSRPSCTGCCRSWRRRSNVLAGWRG